MTLDRRTLSDPDLRALLECRLSDDEHYQRDESPHQEPLTQRDTNTQLRLFPGQTEPINVRVCTVVFSPSCPSSPRLSHKGHKKQRRHTLPANHLPLRLSFDVDDDDDDDWPQLSPKAASCKEGPTFIEPEDTPIDEFQLGGWNQAVKVLGVMPSELQHKIAEFIPVSNWCALRVSGRHEHAMIENDTGFREWFPKQVTGWFQYYVVRLPAYEDSARQAIKFGSSIDRRVGFPDWNAVHWAATYGCYDLLKDLVDKGCDINVMTSMGRTPLIFATMKGAEKCVKLLLDREADVSVQCAKGKRALDYARERRFSVIQWMLGKDEGDQVAAEAP